MCHQNHWTSSIHFRKAIPNCSSQVCLKSFDTNPLILTCPCDQRSCPGGFQPLIKTAVTTRFYSHREWPAQNGLLYPLHSFQFNCMPFCMLMHQALYSDWCRQCLVISWVSSSCCTLMTSLFSHNLISNISRGCTWWLVATKGRPSCFFFADRPSTLPDT